MPTHIYYSSIRTDYYITHGDKKLEAIDLPSPLQSHNGVSVYRPTLDNIHVACFITHLVLLVLYPGWLKHGHVGFTSIG